jgi:hypothetical protein
MGVLIYVGVVVWMCWLQFQIVSMRNEQGLERLDREDIANAFNELKDKVEAKLPGKK